MAHDAKRPLLLAVLVTALLAAPSCGSLRRVALNGLGDAVAESGTTYTSDEDPDLVRDALPFTLKLIESLLDQSPDHVGLLTAAASGFTQYAYAFVQMDADELADTDYAESERLKGRARGLYKRALGYALRGLEAGHPGLREGLDRGREERAAALAALGEEDLELAYWAASSWGLLVSLSLDDPARIAELSRVEAIARRCMEIDEDWSYGALHEFMISFEGGRTAAMGGSAERARAHFERAVELSEGLRASPFVTYAETVTVRNQDRPEFVSLLERALAVDPGARPEWRLLNTVMQRRARWLLEHADYLFLD